MSTTAQTVRCLNCDSQVNASYKYCPYCGQATHQHRLNLAHLGHEVVHFFTHADKGIFYLIKMLAVKPGRVIREYIAGKRKKYFSPLNFFLVVLGLFVFALTTFHTLESVDVGQVRQQVQKISDPVVRERRLAKLDRVEKAYGFMAKYSNFINMALTPLMALIFYLFYFKAGYNYTEHLVGGMYIAGFNALIFVLIFASIAALTKGTPAYTVGILCFLVWEVLYRSVAYYRFINKRGLKYFLYPLLISALITFGWSKLSTSLIAYYIEKGFPDWL